jgi:transposase InsO family protein
VQLPCHGVEWVVKGSAEEVGWSLFPREAGFLDLHHDEKTGPKWVCRRESIYPPCPIAVPLVRVTHVMRLGTQADLTVALQRMGFSGRLNTAFIERVNLTVRHGVAALARRTWATAKPAPQLLAHLEWWRAYYHFVRPHAALRVALVQPRERGAKLVAQRYQQRTPAMAAGRTNRRWTAREVLSCPLPPISA